ncbi:MAG: hypothetical protein II887_04540 [Bacteroidales bacterium]|nr:hypothetical protein [Bacteroidales bacterium]
MKNAESSNNNKDELSQIRVQTLLEIKKIKQGIPMYTGISLTGKQFETGKMTVLRRSLQDVFEHSVENRVIWLWLQNFDIKFLSAMKYKGWAPNRPYPIADPCYDPERPNRSKHDHDTKWFYYYTLRIGQRSYWVNVKNHKHFGEVIYAIESERPKDLIKGHKKSDIENVYSFLQGTGAIDINITLQK